MKRVLITGASGFIGRHALAPLVARGYDVHAVATRPGTAAGLTWHATDLLDPAAVDALVETVRPTHLLHLAWYVAPGKFWQAEENLAWVQASLGLARAFRRVGGRRLVGAGTCAEYDWRHGFLVEGVTPLAPRSLYGTAKLAVGQIWAAYAAAHDLSTAWGRIFFLYGPGEAAGRLVPSVARALLRGDPAACTHGAQVRDFLHVADAAEAFVALLDGDVTGAVNIGSGVPVTLADVVGQLGTWVGRPDLVRLGALPAAADDPPLLVADVRRLAQEVGWQPRRGLSDGLAEALAWWREEARHVRT